MTPSGRAITDPPKTCPRCKSPRIRHATRPLPGYKAEREAGMEGWVCEKCSYFWMARRKA